MNDPAPTTASANRSLALPAATIGLGAFLLFLVQPLLAKRILPWFGGSAAVWTACMLFFQVLLLGGYLYAHLLQKLTAKRQALVHLILLAASLLVLPLSPNPAWKPGITGDPTFRILGLLAATVGLPYLLLSSTSPLVQAWLARERPGWQPYRLFALSNAGSMAALLGYPVLMEPFLALGVQAWVWTAGFGVYLLCAAGMAWRARELPDDTARESASSAAGAVMPTTGLRLLWVLLAFTPSLLLLAVTSHLCTNVAPIPFLWVLPLCLYLLSFIICFDNPRWYARKMFMVLLVPALLGMGWLMLPDHVHAAVRIQVGVFSAALFVACMTAHGELARLRPAPRHLTGFYLSLSFGGAMGGVFAGLVAPRMFSTLAEFPLALVLMAILVFIAWMRDSGEGTRRPMRWSVGLLLSISATVLSMGAAKEAQEKAYKSLAQVRNFYGTLRVVERYEDRDRMRMLVHGNINHGGQFLAGDLARKPTTYYGPQSGVGIALRLLGEQGPLKFGVVGLGSGTLADYARPGDVIRFYEINPLVRRLAGTWFQAIPECEGRAEVVMGDARLSMEREHAQGYDLIAVDAFSSDSIPVHLLTEEAFQQYRRHLHPGGVVAVHISNRYLDLGPVLLAEAQGGGWKTLDVSDEGDDDAGVFSSDWVLMSQDGGLFKRPELAQAGGALESNRRVRRWTDDFSNLYRILK
ncbi:MAG: fused MFS/spermidine synthase [Acidobacteriota bacterium]|nr:fused MFS/spermidine synthase [Acidobacteriota bacterium]